MNRLKLGLVAVASVSIILASTYAVFSFRPSMATPTPSAWTYTANWTCNVPLPDQQGRISYYGFSPDRAHLLGLVPGEYQSRISFHNPSAANITVKGDFVESVQQGPRNVIPKWRSASISWILFPQAGLYVDCYVIAGLLHDNPMDPFSVPTGFVTLTTSNPNLNVIVTYSARTFNATSGGLVPMGISISTMAITAVPVSQ